VLMEDGSLQGKDCRAWLVPPERACNIDTPFDLFLAEEILRRQAAAGDQAGTAPFSMAGKLQQAAGAGRGKAGASE
jgi:hypothetical protein